MGVYLHTPADVAEIKVSRILASALPEDPSSGGHMDAVEFLSRLAAVEDEFHSSDEWLDFVASGGKDDLDRAARTTSFAIGGPGSPTYLWFEDSKLRAARSLAETAARYRAPICWA